ncbi:hypothetical protein TSAR_003736 [Trichomalopsis sarcophagae]|uniref:Peptidase aspartic putative domain-containing protein n=1 Tax=Trichomalopsis sarcophagae TaxID=543379 RepID=A0A232EQ29_9HYME|nr:hypothetical protein TSAR_003736 [Trichomalopsis sarcophagae]
MERFTQAIESTLRTVREATFSDGNSQLINRLTTAKSLPIFSKNSFEWLHFKETLEKTSELGGYRDSENVNRLFAALKDDARKAVDTLLTTTRDPATIMKTLELHYGNKRVIAKKIVNYLVNYLKDMPSIDSGEIKLYIKTIKLEKVANFLCWQAELSANGIFEDDVCEVTQNHGDQQKKLVSRKKTTGAFIAVTEAEREAERRLLARKRSLCFKCLGSGHLYTKCNSANCAICKKGHHTLLHISSSVDDKANTAAGRVNANNGPSKTVKIYALLDDGSTITLISKRVAEEIGVKGKRVRLALRRINGREEVGAYSEKVSFTIAGEFEKHQIRNAIVVSNLCLPSQTLSREAVRHVAKAESVFLQPYEKVRLEIIIGQDNWHLIAFRKTHAV